LYRLKLTTTDGRTILGLFVHNSDRILMERKVRKMSWMLPRNKEGEIIGAANLEFIKVKSYPKSAIYKSDAAYWDHEESLLNKLNKLTEEWEPYDYRENIEEMEEGSTT